MTKPPEPPHESTQALPIIGAGDEVKPSFSLPSSEVSEPLSGGPRPAPSPQDAVPIVGQSYTVEPSPTGSLNAPTSVPPASGFPASAPPHSFPSSGPANPNAHYPTSGQGGPTFTPGYGPLPPSSPARTQSPAGPAYYPPPQQYLGPPRPTPSGGGKGKIFAIAAVALVALIGGTIGLITLLGDDEKSSDDGSDTGSGVAASGEPDEIVEPLITALEDNDTEAIDALLCTENKKSLRQTTKTLTGNGEYTLKLDAGTPETKKMGNDEYTITVDVNVEVEYKGDSFSDEYTVIIDVIIEDDEWKVCELEDRTKR